MQLLESARRVAARAALFGTLALGAVVAHAPSASAQFPMFTEEVSNHRLTMEGLEKFVTATRNLDALEDESINMENRFEVSENEMPDIGMIASAFESEPLIRDAIGKAGLSSREYVTFLFSMVQTMFTATMVEMGGESAFAQMEAGVLKDNVAFFREHKDEIQRLASELESLADAHGDHDGDDDSN
ncbi:hypothetical protein [Longimicrobium terrae]|uniref:DUF4142 domain-containing protein n=1 Tax=Longimicrobium terrae TaxID=1639882 RepID=A0A841H6K9_9BACT|nr:hypothetical protein [Longimicrobium terrae]MBB4639346.1 hypothetical protein [Longimicrobium terrae]MBB6073583.1 hypothetical protein [Longimicrobium terrae]NNC29410.1 hypothetical protein [Longimicrobium terrae]